MQEKNRQYVDIVLDRIKNLAEIETDIELAQVLDSAPKSISAWRSRKSFNYNVVVNACINKGWDINYILAPVHGYYDGYYDGYLKPKVHTKVTIGKATIGQTNLYKESSDIVNNFTNEQSGKYSNENEQLRSRIKELEDELKAKDRENAKLEGQIELLKSLLNK